MITFNLLSALGLGKSVPMPSATTTTEEIFFMGDPSRSMNYFSINFLSSMSLWDIVDKYPERFTHESRELGRLFVEKLHPGSWLVRRDGVKSLGAREGDRTFCLSVDTTKTSYRVVDSYESQRKMLPPGDEVPPASVVAAAAIIHYLKTSEWMMGLVQDSLRCAETYQDCFGAAQRLCVSLDPNRTKLVLMGFGDEISDAHLATAAGRKEFFL